MTKNSDVYRGPPASSGVQASVGETVETEALRRRRFTRLCKNFASEMFIYYNETDKDWWELHEAVLNAIEKLEGE